MTVSLRNHRDTQKAARHSPVVLSYMTCQGPRADSNTISQEGD
jgi:hypothetical protein